MWRPSRVLVTGAGPIGLLAALLARQRGFEVHVLDRLTDGPKPDLVRDLGATYHSTTVAEAGRDCDIAVECTGVSQLVLEVLYVLDPSGIACLTGVSSGGRSLPVDLGSLNRELVLENNVVFGSVNANRRHYEMAAEALANADRTWLDRVINRRVPVERWHDALDRRPGRCEADHHVLRVYGGRRRYRLAAGGWRLAVKWASSRSAELKFRFPHRMA